MSDLITPPTATKADRYGPKRQKVPPFARFKGTSAWKQYRNKARAYARFMAAQRKTAAS